MENFKNIAIDLDVFCENRWKEGMAIRGYSQDDILRLNGELHTGKGGMLWKRREKGYLDTKGLAEELFSLYPEDRSMIETYFMREDEFLTLGIGAYIALVRLRKEGCHICLIGDMPIETACEMEKLPFFPKECITAVVTSGVFHKRMPSDVLFAKLFHQYDVRSDGKGSFHVHSIKPEETLFISGSRMAVRMAESFGARAELVCGQEGMERLLKTL